MKKWRNLGLAAVLGAALVGSVPLISQAANDTPQVTNNGVGLAIGRMGTSMIDSISKFLGLTSDEVRTERQSGKSLTDIASDKGVSKDKLLDQMLKERKVQLDALVKDGKLTQEQADQYLAQMKERMGTMVDRTETGRPDFAPGRGQGMGQGQGQGRGRGAGMQGGNCGGGFGNQVAPTSTSSSL